MTFCDFRKVLIVFLFVFLFYLVSAYTYAETENDISIDYSLDTDTAEIGKPFFVQYSITGGNGQYTRIEIDGTLIDDDNLVAGDAVFNAEEASGTCSIIPYTGSEMVLYIFVNDSDGRSAQIEATIPIVENKDHPINVEFNKSEVTAGTEIVAEYSVANCESLSNGTAIWVICEKGDYETEDEYSRYLDEYTRTKEENITSPAGTLVFAPMYGDKVFLLIKGETEEGNPIYYRSPDVPIIDGHIPPIEIEITDRDEVAIIGKPFHFSYRVTGGSGVYTSIIADSTLIGGDMRVLGSVTSETNQSEGSFDIIPTQGSIMVLYVFVKDSYGKRASFEENGDIVIQQNQDYPVHCQYNKSSSYVGDTITANYSIANIEEIINGELYWVIGEQSEWDPDDYIYSGKIGQQNITEKTGSTSFSPTFGDCAFFILSGEASDGSAVYFVSDKIPIIHGTSRVVLPSGLMRIEAECFTGCTFSEIVIPDTVIDIEGDAIPKSCKIVCHEASYAYEWAEENAYDIVIMN